MKVAYLSLLSPPDQPAVSGVPKVSETLLHAFESFDDLRVEAITLVDGLKEEVTRERGSVRYHYLPCRAKGKTATLYWFEHRRLRQWVRRLGADLVHGQPTGEYLLAATNSGLPHVITIHGLVLRESAGVSSFSLDRLAGLTREFLQRRAIKRAANIISISPYVNDYLGAWSNGRRWPVSNPIDSEFFDIAPPRPEGLRILCVGIVSDRKNQILLVQACQRLCQQGIAFDCHIVGQFSPGMEDRMQHLVRELGVIDHVRLKGRISRAELLREYEWSNVVVLPSREETSPLSLIQALACGRCVFGANAAGIPSLLQNGTFGSLFRADQPEDLACLLARFVSDPAPFWKRAECGQAFARSTFRPASVARLTMKVYEEILRSTET